MKLKSGATFCKHCGHSYHFYVMFMVRGRVGYFYGFSGEEVDNDNMWDGVKLKPQKTAFCGECHKSQGSVIEE